MSYFDDASLAFLPSGAAEKDGKAYSIKPTDGTGDFTFSRGSNLAATRVGPGPNYFIEKGRENLLLQSNQFDTTWGSTNITLTSGKSGYDGTNDAWNINILATGWTLLQSINVSGVHTASVYIKANTSNAVKFRVDQSSDAIVFVNLNNGSIISESGTIKTIVYDIGSGWFKIQMTFNAITTINIQLTAATTGGLNSTGSFYIQDAQLENGLISTDVIETTTTTGTAGILEDTPRFDYSNGASCPSLLLEPSRTNGIAQSEYIGDSSWSKQSSGVASAPIVTSNYAISPEGTLNASRVLFNINGGTSSSDFSQLFAAATSTIGDVTNSVYIKSNTASNYNMSFINALGGSLVSIVVTPEWQRFNITATTVSTSSSFKLRLRGNESTSDSADVSFYGAQLEAGAYPTSYIPTYGTSGTSVTRAADDVNEIRGLTSLIGQSEGSLFLDFVANDEDSLQIIYQIRTTFNVNVGQVDFRIQSGNLKSLGNNGGSNQFNISAGAVVAGTRYKCAVRYANNDVAFYVNGVLKGTDTSASFGSSSLNQIGFNENTGTFLPSVSINQSLVFPTPLTNSELAALTTL